MTLDIEYKNQPINVLGNLNILDLYPLLSDFVVKIDGKIAPDTMRDLLLMGLVHQSGLTNRSFMEVMGHYLSEKGI